MLQVASLNYDVIFKKAFSKPHIFTEFVRDITGIQIEIDQSEVTGLSTEALAILVDSVV